MSGLMVNTFAVDWGHDHHSNSQSNCRGYLHRAYGHQKSVESANHIPQLLASHDWIQFKCTQNKYAAHAEAAAVGGKGGMPCGRRLT